MPYRKTGENGGSQRGYASPPCRQTRYPAADPYPQQDCEQQGSDQDREAFSHFASHFRLGYFAPLILYLAFFFHHGEGEGKDQQDERNSQWQEQGRQVQPNSKQGEEREKGDGEGVFGDEGEHKIIYNFFLFEGFVCQYKPIELRGRFESSCNWKVA